MTSRARHKKPEKTVLVSTVAHAGRMREDEVVELLFILQEVKKHDVFVEFYVRYSSNYVFHDSLTRYSCLGIGYGTGNTRVEPDESRLFQDKMLDVEVLFHFVLFFTPSVFSPVREKTVSYVSFSPPPSTRLKE